MRDAKPTRITRDPRYQALVARRNRFTFILSGVMVAVYFGFLLLVAFHPSSLARPIGGGVTSVGIVLGFGVILLAIGLTGVYVRRAAVEFDPLIDALREDERS